MAHQVRISLHPELLSRWLEDPITKLVLTALKERSFDEQHRFLALPLNSEQYVIERNLFKLAGKSEITKNIVNPTWIKDTLLEDYVEWTTK